MKHNPQSKSSSKVLPIFISLGIVILLITAAIMLGNRGTIWLTDNTPANNVHIENGTQIIDIQVKGGYSPRKSIAKGGIPTVLRFTTKGTFDCSSFVRIPSKSISRSLPQSGSTDIAIGEGVGTLQGFCGMGMYPFEIEFQS